MNAAQRRLLHQAHPAKIAVDLAADVAGTTLFWHRRPLAGLAASLLPAAAASAVLMRTDLGWIGNSRLGPAMLAQMTPRAQSIRLTGWVLHLAGGWRRSPALIVAGWGCILAGWAPMLLAVMGSGRCRPGMGQVNEPSLRGTAKRGP
jgi:hypothetical protein